ncbi:MAG TPA: VOC family protein [Longimicrobiales bacterium]|nr:VOC family protein [Longimicrobiales bacterium]
MSDIQSLSPLITVGEIESCLDFWTDALGFTVTATVPADPSLMGTDAAEGAPLGFAMLQSGDVTIMLQTGASMDGDLPGLSDEVQPSTAMLFLKVEALDPYLPRLEGVEIVHERRTTFYGMDEIFVRGSCGTIVGLAAPVSGEA